MTPISRVKISRVIWKEKAKERAVKNQDLRKKLRRVEEDLALILSKKEALENKAYEKKTDLEEFKSNPKKK